MPGSSLIVSEDPGITFNLRTTQTRTECTDEDGVLEGGGALLEGQERLNIAPPLRLHQ